MSKHTKIICILLLFPLITLIYGFCTMQYITVFNSILTATCIIVFTLFNKKTSMFNLKTFYSVIIFILLAVFMGRTLKMYNIISFWDKLLHFVSGFVIASAAEQIYQKLNGDESNHKLKYWFIFLFATAAAAVWEFYEFFVDSIAHIHAQNGLADTMLDMIAGTVSALIALFLIKKKNRN